jgi:hypothetical protein
LVCNLGQEVADSFSGVDEEWCPSGDLLYRFFRTISDHIKSRVTDKPAIQRKTVKTSLWYLVQGLELRYPLFKFSRHDAANVGALLDDLERAGKILSGRWSKPQWIGVALFEKVSGAWLQTALDEGCLSWDVHISRLLSLCLVVALAGRAGDVILSRGYSTEIVAWRDIQLKLDRGETVNHLEASIMLCNEKRKK